MSHVVRRLAVLTTVPLALGGGLAACGGSDETASAPVTAPAATGPAAGATTPAGTVGGGTTGSGDMAGMDHGSTGSGASSGSSSGSTGSGSTGSASSDSGASGASSSGSSDAASMNRADEAFLRQMIPHHQMAVQMGTMAVRQGAHVQVKQLAVKIITTQGEEISQMQGMAKQAGVSVSGAAAKQGADAKALGLSAGDLGMSMTMMTALTKDRPFDKAFLSQMITHHKGALAMASAEQRKGASPRVKRFAAQIAKEQKREIRQMRSWRKAWY